MTTETAARKLGELKFTSPINEETSFRQRRLAEATESTMTLYDHGIGHGHLAFGIEWDIPALDRTEHIGLQTDRDRVLTDYDGVFSLPAPAIQLLRAHNITVPAEFEDKEEAAA